MNQKGYTTVELLFVLLILVILVIVVGGTYTICTVNVYFTEDCVFTQLKYLSGVPISMEVLERNFFSPSVVRVISVLNVGTEVVYYTDIYDVESNAFFDVKVTPHRGPTR